MMSYKSFIDVLFIILLATLVMLTQSVQLGAVDTALTTLGAGGISPVRADDVQVVVVQEHHVVLDGTTLDSIEDLGDAIRPGDPVLLVTGDADVSHHRVMGLWSQLREHDLDVKLGARPRRAAPGGTVGTEE